MQIDGCFPSAARLLRPLLVHHLWLEVPDLLHSKKMARMSIEEPSVNITLPIEGYSAHPILGNFYLPVEVEDGRKASGIHNLAREGWSEETEILQNVETTLCDYVPMPIYFPPYLLCGGCLHLLERLGTSRVDVLPTCDIISVPRNLPYKDGLRILHPRLQERFGDENVDLALGVLEELIEVEELPPFPPCIFQRWKYEHLRRREDYTNPHCPHTTTIQAPVVPTKTLLDYREQQAQKNFLYPQPSPSAMPSYESLNSKIAHQPSWRIEHSVFVSIGGKQASVAYCPTPAELHKGMWDPEYGRAGARVQTDTAHMNLPESTHAPAVSSATIPKYLTPTKAQLKNAMRDIGKKVKNQIQDFGEFSNGLVHSGVEASPIRLQDSVSLRTGCSHNHDKEVYLTNHFGRRNVELPVGVEVPNANFARKHQLVPKGFPVPDYLLVCRSPTRDEIVARLCEMEIQEAVNCPKQNPLQFFMTKCSSIPATPSVFFDGGLDYKWDDAESILSLTSDDLDTQSFCQDEQRLQLTRLPQGSSFSQRYTVPQSRHRSPQSPRRNDSADAISAHLFGRSYCSAIDSVSDSRPFDENDESNDSFLHRSRREASCEDEDMIHASGHSRVSSFHSMNGMKSSPGSHHNHTEAEILLPTVYAPLPNSSSNHEMHPLVPVIPKENIESLSKSKQQTSKPNDGGISVTSPSWETRYMDAFHNSLGRCVKWSEPEPEADLNLVIGQLSSDTYSQQSSPAHFDKAVKPVHDIKWSSVEPGDLLPRVGAEHFGTINHSHANKDHSRMLGKVVDDMTGHVELPYSELHQTNGSHTLVNATAPPRLHERPFLPYGWREDNHSVTFDKQTEEPPKDLVERGDDFSEQGTLNFDGANDNDSPGNDSTDDNRKQQTASHNTTNNSFNCNNSKNSPQNNRDARKLLMALNNGHLPTISPPEPLLIRKQPSQIRVRAGAERQNDNISHTDTHYPPRTSSIAKYESSQAENKPDISLREVRSNSPIGRSTISSSRGTVFSRATSERPATVTTTHSTVSEIKGYYYSGSSGGFLGDFVPVGSPASVYSPQPQLPGKMTENANSDTRKAAPLKELYRFEPETPTCLNASPQTTFSDFIESRDSRPVSSPNFGHTKHLSPILYTSSHLARPGLQRSGSSPSVSPMRFAGRDLCPSPESFEYYVDPDSPSPIMKSSYNTQSSVRRGRAATLASQYPMRRESPERFQHASSSPVRQLTGDIYQRPSRSPVRQAEKNHGHRPVIATHTPTGAKMISNQHNKSFSSSDSSIINRAMTRSPSKTLVDVFEQDETATESPVLPPVSPKKRSRSPMKKMFGEHGWLGSSPNEIMLPQIQATRSARKLEKPRKAGMMEKIKSKIEELTEKADARNTDKNKVSVLSISISPFEQARYLVELELMIVHTANTFLMTQFSQGRMSIDTIKKTVDTWKNKGRPAVVEFMYDQATQRDLVAVNQFNVRFHGEKLGDDVRIASMLYNWKQVASLMAVRTFCNADTVLLKLLFDIEQILELIGATDSIMLRLQQLRVSINETIRIAKLGKTRREATNGHEMPWDPHKSTSTSRSVFAEDPYGGMKLVPDSYVE
ncbi:DDHD domain protein [Rutstroemia sp. NJR-2017a BVV2]|nr:DDHD domain protein [Rutstroemia sp. NJR-2017a BVV2]